MPFWAIKNKKLEKSKKLHFCKGVNPLFWSKNGHFSKFFSLAIWTKKCLSWVLKQEVSKSRKIDIFLKGLTHGFGPKMAIFQLFFLGNREKENDIYDILERKNAFLAYNNKKFKKLEN